MREKPILLAYAALGVLHKLHWTTFREVRKKLGVGLGSLLATLKIGRGLRGWTEKMTLFAVALEKLSDDSGRA
jgi:hypothetical protein